MFLNSFSGARLAEEMTRGGRRWRRPTYNIKRTYKVQRSRLNEITMIRHRGRVTGFLEPRTISHPTIDNLITLSLYLPKTLLIFVRKYSGTVFTSVILLSSWFYEMLNNLLW